MKPYSYKGRHRLPRPTPRLRTTAVIGTLAASASLVTSATADTPAVNTTGEGWETLRANAAPADPTDMPQILSGVVNQMTAEYQLRAQAEYDNLMRSLENVLNYQAEQERLRVEAEAAEAARVAAEQSARAAELANQAAGVGDTLVVGDVALPAAGSFSSPFGMRWGAMHAGVDIANAAGTPIYAAMSGTVIDSGPASGYGNWIRILHDDGTVTLYGHMQTLAVSVGQRVAAGQYIAGMGSLGYSTGPHLHFQVHPGGGAPIDPHVWLSERGIQL